MKITSVKELLEAINEHDLFSNNFEMDLTILSDTENTIESVAENHIPKEVAVKTFNNNEKFDFSIVEEDHNTIYIKDYNFFDTDDDICGYGQLMLEHTTVNMNLCSCNKKPSCKLTIDVDGKVYEDVKFIIKKSDKQSLQISKNILD